MKYSEGYETLTIEDFKRAMAKVSQEYQQEMDNTSARKHRHHYAMGAVDAICDVFQELRQAEKTAKPQMTVEQIREKVKAVRDYWRSEADKLPERSKARAIVSSSANAMEVLYWAISENDLGIMRDK